MVLLVLLLESVYITGLLTFTFCYSTLAKPFLQAYLPKLGYRLQQIGTAKD